jgi:hypothetical protein
MTKERARLRAGSLLHAAAAGGMAPTTRGNIGQSSPCDAGGEPFLAWSGAAKHDCMPKAHDHKAMYQRIGMANSFQRIHSRNASNETRLRADGSRPRDACAHVFFMKSVEPERPCANQSARGRKSLTRALPKN